MSVAAATWSRTLPTEPGLYWSAFRWPPATREMYPEHASYVVRLVTVFNVNTGGGSYGLEVNTLYVKDLLANAMVLEDIAKYEYDVLWIACPTPAPPPP